MVTGAIVLKRTLKDELYQFHLPKLSSPSNQSFTILPGYHHTPVSFSPTQLSNPLISSIYIASLCTNSNSNLVHCNQSSMSNLNLWHQRLGNPVDRNVKIFLNKCKRKFSRNENFSFCTTCQLGKRYKLHFPISYSTHHTPLDLVYSNVWDPTPTLSSNGFHYYVSFIDANSKFTWFYFLKVKFEVLYLAFYHFKTQVELHLNCKLKNLRIDWGGEFHSLKERNFPP